MPEGWLLALLVLLGAIVLQLAVVVVVHRVRDGYRRRRGRPTIAEERARRVEQHGDEALVPVGFGLPGLLVRRDRPGR